jgi:hypothetical protein
MRASPGCTAHLKILVIASEMPGQITAAQKRGNSVSDFASPSCTAHLTAVMCSLDLHVDLRCEAKNDLPRSRDLAGQIMAHLMRSRKILHLMHGRDLPGLIMAAIRSHDLPGTALEMRGSP